MPEQLPNYIAGQWQRPTTADVLTVDDPATTESLAEVPLSGAADVDAAVEHATQAFADWRCTPVTERVQPLYRLKRLLEAQHDELARTLTRECGKTLAEAHGEIQRGIENVEVACGMPSLIQGYNNEDVARGIDEHMIRQPVGVVAAITPFNFPGMIPLWFLPYAIACGNPFILKPSEKVPMTMQRLFDLIAEIDLPPGVAQLVHGGKETVLALLDHPGIQAISFVGSSEVAADVYRRAAASGKRVQCQGGAKNPVVVLPDADLDQALPMIAESAFGCAGQRCLAASLAITVGEARGDFTERIVEAARDRRVGHGLDEGIEMGPVITDASKARIAGLIDQGVRDGGRLLVDGRDARVIGYECGNFLRPTILENVGVDSPVASTEIFGPVLGLHHAETIDEAIALVNQRSFGNMACLFTRDGGAARRFRYEVEAGNIGINIGVAAPMAFFPFSGWKLSFYGDLHGQGRDAVQFYTEEKVVVERW
ncbi:MAG: CoA-acylating methylmalonate-semialdehyde dehydrogenase [Acidobacteriota bacterium]